MDPRQETIVADSYEQWRAHPITKLFVGKLEEKREKFVNFLALHATNANVTDAHFRAHAAELKEALTTLSIINDYNKMIKQQEPN